MQDVSLAYTRSALLALRLGLQLHNVLILLQESHNLWVKLPKKSLERFPMRGEYSVFLLLLGWIGYSWAKPAPYSRRAVGRDGIILVLIFEYQFGKQFVLAYSYSFIPIPVDFNLDLGHERRGELCPPSPFNEQVACALQYCVSNMITYSIVK